MSAKRERQKLGAAAGQSDSDTEDTKATAPPIKKKGIKTDGESHKFVYKKLTEHEKKLYRARVLDLLGPEHRLDTRTAQDPPYDDDHPCHQCGGEISLAISNGKEIVVHCASKTGRRSMRCTYKSCKTYPCFRMYVFGFCELAVCMISK